jgi:GNAT superfamily N-acetyltransferase
MIRQCGGKDFESVHAIINEAAHKYKGIIPEDRWKEPYMAREELEHEVAHGVVFWGYERHGELIGVMGIQHVQDVTLIRHAYIRTASQGRGIGSKLLSFLVQQTRRPILIGTWANAAWAIRFYEKRGFRVVPAEKKDLLLKKYWSVPERQIETSVVLADRKWFDVSEKSIRNRDNGRS